MQQGRDKFFADALKLVMGDPAPIFKRAPPYSRGDDCVQTAKKVLPAYAGEILTNADKHHLFAKLTMRNGETDDEFEKLWLPRTGGTTPWRKKPGCTENVP